MKLALVGIGQMGQAVERVALERGHEIVARFDETRPFLDAADPSALAGAEVAVEFSLPELAVPHVERYCAWKQPAVVGTTGWYDDLDRVRELVERSDTGLLYAPNFSLGVALLVHALRSITPLLDKLPEYDIYVHELHHTKKVDSPSGTALLLANTLVDGLERKTHVETETQHRRIEGDALHVTSTRIGGVVGHHTVGLDSPFDRLEFIHDAKNRQGFAAGAVRSAEWLPGKKGLFTLDDVLRDWG